MSDIGMFPLDSATHAYGQAILPQRRFSPGAVGGLDGPKTLVPSTPEHFHSSTAR
jgi:hypothetical protein